MSNPYQPPIESSENKLPAFLAPSTYVGGFWGVLVLGVVGGLFVAGLVFSEVLVRYLPTPFIVPGIAWIGALVALMFMLRGPELAVSTKVGVAILLAIPAYILYVPVCTITAMFSQAVFGADGYGPTSSGLVFSSVVCFVGILLLFAGGVRLRFKQRAPSNEEPHLSVPDRKDFASPMDQPTDE